MLDRPLGRLRQTYRPPPPLTVQRRAILAGVMGQLLTDDEVTAQLAELSDWKRADGDEPAITATYTLDGFAGALAFVNQVGAAAEEMNHHPDIDIRWDTVTLVLSTHSEGGLTAADFELAGRIARLIEP